MKIKPVLFWITLIAGIFFVLGLLLGTPQQAMDSAAELAGKLVGKIIKGEDSPTPSPPSFSQSGGSASKDEFSQWVLEGAQDIEKSSLDPLELEDQLRQRAQTLSEEERQHLVDSILDLQAAGKVKIFAIYVLSLAPSTNKAALEQLMSTPLHFQGPQATHSPEETLSMQEKTLRRMAIDALFELASKDSEYLPELKAKIAQIKDPYLREYALKKLQETHGASR